MGLFNKWEILIAWISNSDGSPPAHKHRCVYFQDSVKLPGGILVFGITSEPWQWKDGYSVDLPFEDKPGGHHETHLVKRSIFQAEWHEHIMPAAAQDEPVGIVPEECHKAIEACVARRIQDIKLAARSNPQNPRSS